MAHSYDVFWLQGHTTVTNTNRTLEGKPSGSDVLLANGTLRPLRDLPPRNPGSKSPIYLAAALADYLVVSNPYELTVGVYQQPGDKLVYVASQHLARWYKAMQTGKPHEPWTMPPMTWGGRQQHNTFGRKDKSPHEI